MQAGAIRLVLGWLASAQPKPVEWLAGDEFEAARSEPGSVVICAAQVVAALVHTSLQWCPDRRDCMWAHLAVWSTGCEALAAGSRCEKST